MKCFLCPTKLPKRLQIHPRYTKNLINKPQFYCERDWQRNGKPKPEKVEGVRKPRPHICCTSPVKSKHNAKCSNWGEDLSDLKDIA